MISKTICDAEPSFCPNIYPAHTPYRVAKYQLPTTTVPWTIYSTKIKPRSEFIRGAERKQNQKVQKRFLTTQEPQITTLNRKKQNTRQKIFRWKPPCTRAGFFLITIGLPRPPFAADDLDGEVSSRCPGGNSGAALRPPRLANPHFHAHSLSHFVFRLDCGYCG